VCVRACISSVGSKYHNEGEHGKYYCSSDFRVIKSRKIKCIGRWVVKKLGDDGGGPN
jgi:hypothetical protein